MGSWLVSCVKVGGVGLGSLHLHLLSGRLLFKDLHYYCRDYSIRLVRHVLHSHCILVAGRVSRGYASVGWWRWCCAGE